MQAKTRTRPQLSVNEGVALAHRVAEKYRPVWLNRTEEQQASLASYFLPHRSSKQFLEPTRPGVIKWYCPFADQSVFPSGHRYCVNTYTGCTHACTYCYAASYEPEHAGPKRDFEKLVVRDLEDLERFDVPPAPLHMSNSTDPFQPLERCLGHTRYALERVAEHRQRFTSITMLTKNPGLSAELGYTDLFKKLNRLPVEHACHDEFSRRGLPGFTLAVSLAFWRDEARVSYDPGAPSVAERVQALREVSAAGIPLVLRIDPLFPRSLLPERQGRSLADFGVPEAQTLEDLEALVALARELHVRHVVYSTARIVQPRGRKLGPLMQAMRAVYAALAAPQRLEFRGGSFRLPPEVVREHVERPFLELCRKYRVAAKHCRQDLIQTP